ncbi:MAG: hypothetical protein AABZ94_07850 [Candidatus Eisenbacteria bacterium]
MGPRIRSLRFALLATTLVALTVLPGTWLPQVPGNAFGPATAWAGGTPDETLNPPPAPPKKSGSSSLRCDPSISTSEAAVVGRASRRTMITKFDRLMAVWTIVRATTLRM